MFTVSDLANKAQVSPDTVRHYVKVGLLHPGRHADNAYKIFTQSDVRRVQFIRNAKYLGLTLKEISEIVNHAKGDDTPCPRVREILDQHVISNRKKLDKMSMLQYQMELALLQWDDMPNGNPDGASVCQLIHSNPNESLFTNETSKCFVCEAKLRDTHFICKKENLFYYFCSKDCCNSVSESTDLTRESLVEYCRDEYVKSHVIRLKDPLSEEIANLVETILSEFSGVSKVLINDIEISVTYDENKTNIVGFEEAVKEIEIAINNHWFDILRHRLMQLMD